MNTPARRMKGNAIRRACSLIPRGARSRSITGAVGAIFRLIPESQRFSVLLNLSRCQPRDRLGALQEAAVAVLEGRITPAGAIATFYQRQARHRRREVPISQFVPA